LLRIVRAYGLGPLRITALRRGTLLDERCHLMRPVVQMVPCTG
jgi:hypothetical protein